MKKIFIVLMVAAAFVGCSQKNEDSSTATERAKAQTRAKQEERMMSAEAQFEARINELKKLGKRRDANKDSLNAVYDAYLREQAQAHIGEKLGLEITRTLSVDYNCKQLDSVMNLCSLYKEDPELNKLYNAAKAAEATAPGKKYIDFVGEERKSNKPRPLSSYVAKGKPVVLTFWSSSSIASRDEIRKYIFPYEEAYRDKVTFVSTAVWEDTIYDAQRAASELEMTWTMLYAGEKTNSPTDAYGILRIPNTFIMGADGIIKARNLRGEEIEAAIKKALGR